MFKFVIKVMSWTVLERKMHPRQKIYRFGMNDNGVCFEAMHPKCDLSVLGCIALERIIEKCNPQAGFEIQGCMSFQTIFSVMHPIGKILVFGMKKYLTLCILNTHYRYTGCITAKKCFYHCLRRCCAAVFERQIVYNCMIDKNIATGLFKYQEYRFGIPRRLRILYN